MMPAIYRTTPLDRKFSPVATLEIQKDLTKPEINERISLLIENCVVPVEASVEIKDYIVTVIDDINQYRTSRTSLVVEKYQGAFFGNMIALGFADERALGFFRSLSNQLQFLYLDCTIPRTHSELNKGFANNFFCEHTDEFVFYLDAVKGENFYDPCASHPG